MYSFIILIEDMTSIVIIGKNEGQYVDDMIKSLPGDWRKIYVADRCTDGTIEKLWKYDNTYTLDTTPYNFTGRKTSTCRNLGVRCCPDEDDILFLDGDRVVVEGDIREVIKNCNTDILLFPLAEGDNRVKDNYDFSKAYGSVINDFFSCGIWFKRSAIKKIQDHPLMKGQVFPEFLQDMWGVEDTGLGDLCYSLGLTADLCKEIRLRGYFETTEFKSLDPIEQRFKFRQYLPNLKWDGWKNMN